MESTRSICSEVQAGVIFVGVSTGPYINPANNFDVGWQFTGKVNYGLGIDYRWRSHEIENEHFLSFYVKGIVDCAGCDADDDGDSDSGWPD